MVSKSVSVPIEDLSQLKDDIALIKNILLDEGKLTDWAKKELERARATPESEWVSHKEVEKMLTGK